MNTSTTVATNPDRYQRVCNRAYERFSRDCLRALRIPAGPTYALAITNARIRYRRVLRAALTASR